MEMSFMGTCMALTATYALQSGLASGRGEGPVPGGVPAWALRKRAGCLFLGGSVGV